LLRGSLLQALKFWNTLSITKIWFNLFSFCSAFEIPL
jgi:hypothetical protein